ncbi:splicing regulator SDE2 [Pelodytes ibericus]
MALSVWVRDGLTGGVSAALRPQEATIRDLIPHPDSCLRNDFYVKCNGRLVDLEEKLQNGFFYSVEPRLCGGKGGFGSMLRALGAQIEKTTNREACRDLSGRRLRDVNHEKAMAEWIKKQADREAEKEQRRLERLQRKLAEPKHYFTDPEYHRQCSDMSERLEDSVIKGLQASSSTVVTPEASEIRKRKSKGESSKSASGKKKCLWTGVEGLEVSSSSDSESDPESPSCASVSSASSKRHSAESPSDSDSSDTQPEPPETVQPLEELPESSQQETLEKQPVCDTEPVKDPLPETQPLDERVEETQPLAEPVEEQPPETQPLAEPVEEQPPEIQPLAEPVEEQPPEIQPLAEPVEEQPPEIQPLAEPVKEQPPENQETDRPAQETPNMSLQDTSPMDLLTFNSAAELEALGLERLKLELVGLGLKCGGTLQERAVRLYSVKGLSKDQMDTSLFAKPAKKKKK